MSIDTPTIRSDPTKLADELLEAVRRRESTAELVEQIAGLNEEALESHTDDWRSATAFWVNCYNAFTQLRLDANPRAYESRRDFFTTRAFTVAGTDRSLDDIEHGILRRSKWKYGLGYIPKPFPDRFERRHRLNGVDPRIHFALNCGAESCPPILAYTTDNIDEELDLATESYLDQTVVYEADTNRVQIPRLFLWFRGDFGGKRGIRSFLRRYGAIPEDTTPKHRYLAYDWSRHAGKWYTSNSE
jgi:hypothetical protein